MSSVIPVYNIDIHFREKIFFYMRIFLNYISILIFSYILSNDVTLIAKYISSKNIDFYNTQKDPYLTGPILLIWLTIAINSVFLLISIFFVSTIEEHIFPDHINKRIFSSYIMITLVGIAGISAYFIFTRTPDLHLFIVSCAQVLMMIIYLVVIHRKSRDTFNLNSRMFNM